MDPLAALVQMNIANRQGTQRGIQDIQNFADERRIKQLTQEFLQMPDKSEEGIQLFAAKNRMKPEEIQTVIGMAGVFNKFAEERKTTQQRDSLMKMLQGFGGEQTPELRKGIAQYGALNPNSAFAIMQALGLEKPMSEQETEITIDLTSADGKNKTKARVGSDRHKQLLASGWAEGEPINTGTDSRGGMTESQKLNVFDKYANTWVEDSMASDGWSFDSGQWMKDGELRTGKEAIAAKSGLKAMVTKAKKLYLENGGLPEDAFSQAAPKQTGPSKTTQDYVNAGKQITSQVKPQQAEPAVPGIWDTIISNVKGRMAPKTETAPAVQQPKTAEPTQYTDVTIAKDGSIWGKVNGQARRIAVKPPEKIYNNKYDNPKYAEYLKLLEQYGLQ